MAPGSFQTDAPIIRAYANWQATVANGVASDAGNIGLGLPEIPVPVGFTAFSASQVQALAAILAAGSPPPTAGAPDDGSALGFIAPAFATGSAGTVAFSGTDAVLLASATPQATFFVTLTSMNGGTLGVADFNGTVIGSASGPSLLVNPLAVVNTVRTTDTLQRHRRSPHRVGGQQRQHCGARCRRQISVGGFIRLGLSGGPPATRRPPGAASLWSAVQGSRVVPGNLNIGAGGINTLLAALAERLQHGKPYDRRALEVLSGGAACHRSLAPARSRSIGRCDQG